MRTRTVRADEPDLFVEAGGAPEHRYEVKSYVEDMFAAGFMRPEWCFVLEDGDRAVGRVALWTLPKSEEPLDALALGAIGGLGLEAEAAPHAQVPHSGRE